MIDVSDDLRRELVYTLNAELLRGAPDLDAAHLTAVFLRVLREDGPRHHEPDLVGTWATAAGTDPEDLELSLESALEVILDELADDEAAWSAHRLLDLLAEEPFWRLHWGLPGEPPPPLPPTAPRGVALPLPLRTHLVRILDRLELRLHQANQELRSVHDVVPDRVFDAAITDAMDAVRSLARQRAEQGGDHMRHALTRDRQAPTLQTALRIIQRWKLAVDFDASPAPDDGEWTMRVLDRLYRLEWVVPQPNE